MCIWSQSPARHRKMRESFAQWMRERAGSSCRAWSGSRSGRWPFGGRFARDRSGHSGRRVPHARWRGELDAPVSTELRWPQPVVSLAFDPADSKTLYAGTPHLAWKTSNAGATWRRLSRGMQADSDIFSIDVDTEQRSRLFAGACSGLYSSLDGGGTWSSLERAVGAQFRTYVVVRAPNLPSWYLREPAAACFDRATAE